MKRLNRKGFTLIELLAVIVILAIIVVVTVPSIISSINSARLSSLHSLAKEVASWYETSYAQDLMALGDEKILKGADLHVTTSWQCLGSVMDTETNPKSLADLYGLSSNDLILTGSTKLFPDDPDNNEQVNFTYTYGGAYETMTQDHCSAIKYNNWYERKVEILLVAKSGGKFDTKGSGSSYAVSYGIEAYDNEV